MNILTDCTSARPRSATILRRFALVAAFAVAVALPGQAANLLSNPSFEANNGHALPTGWTRFAPTNAAAFGNYWIEGNVPAHAGTLYWKQWGAAYDPAKNNTAGLEQNFSGAPGSTYQASGWFYFPGGDALGANSFVWLEVSFLGATSNLLAVYKSDNVAASAGTGAWLSYEVNRACDLSAPVSIGDPNYTTYAVTGTVTQLVAPLGTTTVRYRFALLQHLTEGGACYLDDAVLEQVSGPVPPVISNLSPLNLIFANPADGITFNVSSPSGFTINSSSIRLVVNQVDVSGSLNISGSASSKNVAWYGLQSNTVYDASITVTDSFNLSASAITHFETTWVGIPPVLYSWEAEDFDFASGLYINQPTLCNSAGSPTCYFGKVGVEGVDEHVTGSAPSHLYRPDDPVGTLLSGDYNRKAYVTAGVFDYRIDPFNTDMWLNYTRDWSNGTYWVIGRLSTDIGLNGTITLSKVHPDTSTTSLGTFKINGGKGWSSFENVYLKDTNGNSAVVTLNGKETLRITTAGNLLPNFFMLVAAQADLPLLSNLYPTGSRPFEYTNTLRFTATTLGATFPVNGIKVILDGVDISSNLVVTGSASVKDVVYAQLQPNALHTAVITATNSLGRGIAVTNRFDTFDLQNFSVELEDFDYDGGQFISDWIPDVYWGLAAATNVDFQHLSLVDEQFNYRPAGTLPTALAFDWLRPVFAENLASDFVLAWFAGTDWANYTRNYPAGHYHVYGRFSGGGPYSMYLDQVLTGAGTATQVTRRIGKWGAVGVDYRTYNWVPLTDAGLVAPAVLSLNGLATLRVTTDGFCNPNFFMLVPANGISLSASRTGGNIVLSFPTIAGGSYRVFAKDDLAGNWTLVTTLSGDGTTQTVSQSLSGIQRYYKVSSP